MTTSQVRYTIHYSSIAVTRLYKQTFNMNYTDQPCRGGLRVGTIHKTCHISVLICICNTCYQKNANYNFDCFSFSIYKTIWFYINIRQNGYIYDFPLVITLFVLRQTVDPGSSYIGHMSQRSWKSCVTNFVSRKYDFPFISEKGEYKTL